ncbi:PAAR domain-containing protein [Burkholderia pseudomallei]|uniref:PAAR domain-containing protein n=1 Tax=Burkholderia pseudomallei TaxID=28450 RepID=UPI001A966A05|nr:PAAR domain-containing protein [Burkholderia pseudomallei]QSY06571.1 PAAR domain-containing protein [Burkholderia pseudomallei]QSY14354.1 PAAR domain-containing protein [Burkholderia pseudomallei]QTB63926.1 PAAR domain-containing protein [Burkholderia pseudomallei]
MKRNMLVVGDRTTAGGVVQEGVAAGFNNGTPLAYHGALVHCPACKSEGRIVGVGPTWPMTFDGKQVALENDLCICKCDPPPRMIASKNDMFMTFEGHQLAQMGYASDGSPLSDRAMHAFDEQVRILDEHGEPLANVPYHIRDQSGNEYQGLTDQDGLCPRVSTASIETLSIAVGVAALEKWKK